MLCHLTTFREMVDAICRDLPVYEPLICEELSPYARLEHGWKMMDGTPVGQQSADGPARSHSPGRAPGAGSGVPPPPAWRWRSWALPRTGRQDCTPMR